MRRSTSMDRPSMWLTFPRGIRNRFVWLCTWSVTSTLNMVVASGIPLVRHDLSLGPRYGEAKRRAHDHDHAHYLSVLHGRLLNDSGIVSVKHAPKRNHQGWLSGGCSHSPRPRLILQVHQSVHGVFVRLETRVGHVYSRHKEDVEQEGRQHAPLMKALFYGKPPRAHPVIESHACSHAIMELMNGRDLILWHAKTGEYRPREGSVNGVVCFGKVDKVYIQRNSFLPRQLLWPTKIILY